MTTYPHRYGDTNRAVEHYATACVASAKILRSEGLPGIRKQFTEPSRPPI